MSVGGLSESRLRRMRDVMAGHVASGQVPGIVTLVSRRGEVHVEAYGNLALGASAPMRRDTLFRIASITKPITAVAAMILVEECRLRLDDPVDPWLPELANRRVLKSLDGPVDDTIPAKRSITLRDLLTFKLGLGAIMAMPGTYPIQKVMDDAGVAPSPIPLMFGPDEALRRFGTLPLIHQPGEDFLYHSGSDILGVLIARVTGQSLDAFLRVRIFEPLGMLDTAFSVPEAKLDRLATAYQLDWRTGKLKVFDAARGGIWSRPAVFESGGGGLVSTVDDYHAFCRMLLNRGQTESGERILSRPSVELMTTDHLTAEQKAGARIFFADNSGWGFGLAVNTHRDDLSVVPGRFGWTGGYGTSAYSDPQEDLVGILMTQRMMDTPAPPQVFADFWTCTYQAIDD